MAYLAGLRVIWEFIIEWQTYCLFIFVDSHGESKLNLCEKERKTMNYKMIRGDAATARCRNISVWGSPLYCECGCQTPREADPVLDLSDIVISRKSGEGYANFILKRKRNGIECGSYNSQYGSIYLDGNEFLGVDKETVAHLFADVLSKKFETLEKTMSAGDTLEETAAVVTMGETIALMEQDESHAHHHGYCNKCHSYCYGDCEA